MAQFQGTWEDRELDPSALAFMDAIGLLIAFPKFNRFSINRSYLIFSGGGGGQIHVIKKQP